MAWARVQTSDDGVVSFEASMSAKEHDLRDGVKGTLVRRPLCCRPAAPSVRGTLRAGGALPAHALVLSLVCTLLRLPALDGLQPPPYREYRFCTGNCAAVAVHFVRSVRSISGTDVASSGADVGESRSRHAFVCADLVAAVAAHCRAQVRHTQHSPPAPPPPPPPTPPRRTLAVPVGRGRSRREPPGTDGGAAFVVCTSCARRGVLCK